MPTTVTDVSHGPRARRPVALPLAAVTLFSLVACGSGPDGGRQAQSSPAPHSGATSSSSPPASHPFPPASDEPAVGSTAIRVRIGGTVLTARLRDVPAARELVAQLPVTLTFRDLNDVEKISRLPRALSVDGVPPGDDPAPRDIGYYAPSGDLVFYYGDVGYWSGIVRLGRFDGSVDAIQDQTGEFSVTVELADGG
jgi:hypothetical protein